MDGGLTMTLSEKQQLHTRLQAKMDAWLWENGYEFTDGDAFRDPRVHGKVGEAKGYGHRSSCHKLRLARDRNLFKGGKYLSSTEDHRAAGAYWKSLHPLCRWGGDFPTPDGNHYSLEHEGKK